MDAGSMVGPIIGGAMGTVGAIFGGVAGMKADKALSKLKDQDPVYEFAPYMRQRMALAQATLNSRAAGAAAAEQNIVQAQANTQAQVNRNATDSSMALMLAAAGQGQAMDAYGKLAVLDAQTGEQRRKEMGDVQDAATMEYRHVKDDEVRRWQDKVNIIMAQNAMRQAGAQNFINAGGAAASGASSAMSGM
jgi:hypothetical protein